MTDKTAKTLTSSGYYVSQEAPIQTDNPIACLLYTSDAADE